MMEIIDHYAIISEDSEGHILDDDDYKDAPTFSLQVQMKLYLLCISIS